MNSPTRNYFQIFFVDVIICIDIKMLKNHVFLFCGTMTLNIYDI
jgi:hypothetical protein